MTQIKREQLMKHLEKLNDACELPGLYLTNYFVILRNDVDKEIVSKQINLQDKDQKKHKKLNELWQEIIIRINSLESQCINCAMNLSENKQKINSIESQLLNNVESIDLSKLKDIIENEEINLMQNLFQNKTIVFYNIKDLKNSETDGAEFKETEIENLIEPERELIDGKLIILNGETFRLKAFENR